MIEVLDRLRELFARECELLAEKHATILAQAEAAVLGRGVDEEKVVLLTKLMSRYAHADHPQHWRRDEYARDIRRIKRRTRR